MPSAASTTRVPKKTPLHVYPMADRRTLRLVRSGASAFRGGGEDPAAALTAYLAELGGSKPPPPRTTGPFGVGAFRPF
jgi:hypothetical protein